MFAGHFGLAAAAKAKAPELPLWVLMLGTQALDAIFVPLLLTGVEGFVPVAGHGYGAHLIQAGFSHSLLGTVLLAVAVGWLAARRWGRRGGIVLGAVVASHWVLDLLMHRPDLPLLPGNALQLPLLGLGLWRSPGASLLAEVLVVSLGAWLYGRSLADGRAAGRAAQVRLASGAMAVGLFAALALDVLGVG